MIVLKSLLLGLSQLGLRTHHVISTCTVFGQIAKEGVKDAGAWPVQFGTITVADGIAWGHQGCVSH